MQLNKSEQVLDVKISKAFRCNTIVKDICNIYDEAQKLRCRGYISVGYFELIKYVYGKEVIND